MCLSEVGRVVEVDTQRHSAAVDIGDRVVAISTVTLGLDSPPPDIGDWLVVHTGFAVERLGEGAAAEILRARQELTPSTIDGDPKERP